MHYSNGREAKIGDLVRGKGYNLKYEFTGVMLHINPQSDVCNCKVSTISHNSHPVQQGWFKDGVIHYPTLTEQMIADIEYGQCDQFVAINPQTGEILEKE